MNPPKNDTPAKANRRGKRARSAVRLKGKADASAITDKLADGGTPSRGALVRARVLHAALECFGTFGFEGTSTRAVAERAGVSHTLLLYHFDSKEQLWRTTMEDVIGRYRHAYDARLHRIDGTDARACLRAFVENFVQFSAEVPQLHRIMTQESTQGSERVHWLIDNHLSGSFDAAIALIRRCQAEGAVRDGEPARLYYAIIGLGGTLMSVSAEFKHFTGRDVFTAAELQKTTQMIFDFIFTDAAGAATEALPARRGKRQS